MFVLLGGEGDGGVGDGGVGEGLGDGDPVSHSPTADQAPSFPH